MAEDKFPYRPYTIKYEVNDNIPPDMLLFKPGSIIQTRDFNKVFFSNVDDTKWYIYEPDPLQEAINLAVKELSG